MKRLTIKYDDATLFDGDVTEFQWNESNSAVAAKATVPSAVRSRPATAPAAGKLLDMLSAAAAAKSNGDAPT